MLKSSKFGIVSNFQMLSNSADFSKMSTKENKNSWKSKKNLKQMRLVSSLCSDLIWGFWIKWKIPKVLSKITCFRQEENLVNISHPFFLRYIFIFMNWYQLLIQDIFFHWNLYFGSESYLQQLCLHCIKDSLLCIHLNRRD